MNDHEHRYYIAGKTYTEFTPHSLIQEMDNEDEFLQSVQLYKRTEYAVLSCICGDIFRKVVKNG